MKKTIIVLISVFLLSSCGGNSGASTNLYSQSSSDTAESITEEEIVNEKEDINIGENIERKLIITANITINSKDVEKTYKSVEEKTKEYKGYFDNVESSKNRYYLTIRIPKENLNNFILFLEENENVENKNINTKDVTDTYYDTENRVKNREVLLEKLRNYLREAKNIDEILKVEDRINTLTYEIESMKGTLENLNSSVNYSKVTLNISDREAMKSGNANLYNKYINLISFLKAFFSSIGFFLIGFVAVSIPIVLIAALFYYICFGKIGLIRKLYKKIK
ncbi:DUF4349 domain-containing protein [Brachyspira murdochii]|uniref:DUF4349 domain-containing protein n=1 Tax=Brachyspira murdochii TaxID=84378 RepID=UPI0012F47EC8|nr:DUF4349 domain-containing protein [Brachyspira murdochii]